MLFNISCGRACPAAARTSATCFVHRRDAIVWAVVDPWEIRGTGEVRVSKAPVHALRRILCREKPSVVVARESALREALERHRPAIVAVLPPEPRSERSAGRAHEARDAVADRLGDRGSLAWYRVVAHVVPREVVLAALARAVDLDIGRIRRSRAAYFTAIVRPHVQAARRRAA